MLEDENILHKDISLENFLVFKKQKIIRIIDFGSA